MSWHKEVFNGEDMELEDFLTTREVDFYYKGHADGYSEAKRGELASKIWILVNGVWIGALIIGLTTGLLTKIL